MVNRLPDPHAQVQPLVDRLIELHNETDPAHSDISPEQKAAYAREALALWWKIYNELVFWAQCEILGEDIMSQRPGLLAVWQEKNRFDAKAERHFAEALGYRFSVGGRLDKKKRDTLEKVVGPEQIDLIKFLATAGLEAPGSYIRALFSNDAANNKYLRAELQRSLEEEMRPLTEKEVAAEDREVASAGKLLWKLEALRQVRVLVGRGHLKVAALLEVSSAISHSVDELQEWERQLVKFEEFENDLFCAEIAGEHEAYLRTGHYSNIRNYQRYGSFDGVPNMARAAKLAKKLRHVRMADIRAALRGIR